MASRIERFKELLAKDEGLDLSDEQRHRVATLLAFAGVRFPIEVWTTREELVTAPQFTILEDSDDAVYERWGDDVWRCVGWHEAYTVDDILLPVKVYHLPEPNE